MSNDESVKLISEFCEGCYRLLACTIKLFNKDQSVNDIYNDIEKTFINFVCAVGKVDFGEKESVYEYLDLYNIKYFKESDILLVNLHYDGDNLCQYYSRTRPDTKLRTSNET